MVFGEDIGPLRGLRRWRAGDDPEASHKKGLYTYEPCKVQAAILLRTDTPAGNAWIARKLAMGHTGSVRVAPSLTAEKTKKC
jgi:hypothetical protein